MRAEPSAGCLGICGVLDGRGLVVEGPNASWLNAYYSDLLANTEEFDPCGYYAVDMAGKYPIVQLRSRILADWPSN